MRNKIVAMIGVCVLALGSLAACGTTDEVSTAEVAEEVAAEEAQTEAQDEAAPVAETETAAEEATETTEAEEEGVVGIAGEWVDITEDEAKELVARLFQAPEGAEVLEWMKCEALADEENSVGPMVQLDFELDDMMFTARAQMGAAEDADIAGLFVDEWTVGPEDVTLANWGEGNMQGKMYRLANESGYVDLITWYDVEIGISYCLTVSGADLDGFDIQAVAEQMYCADNEPVVE